MKVITPFTDAFFIANKGIKISLFWVWTISLYGIVYKEIAFKNSQRVRPDKKTIVPLSSSKAPEPIQICQRLIHFFRTLVISCGWPSVPSALLFWFFVVVLAHFWNANNACHSTTTIRNEAFFYFTNFSHTFKILLLMSTPFCNINFLLFS